MNYFASVRTVPELKTEYKRLVMENHPDRGGDPIKTRTIIEQYKELLEKGIHVRYEEVTVDDVEEYFNDVADLMDYEEDDFLNMDYV